ncbi:sugar phosphate isomerase/epimerase [Microlunatus spumicola]|uniref:Sugar phosphate isomerase/epimerase n=1 Tax=Microlunatus spumicola TaxID=81499 RepID=A0ABP6XJG3_9ACTN
MCIGDEQARDLDLGAGRPEGHSHDISRRGVLRGAAVGAAALGLSGGTAAVASAAGPAAAKPHHLPSSRISIQLYTLRNQLEEDLSGTLESLADIGYRRVEHAGFVGRSVTEFKAALDAVGITATSGHVAIPQPFDADTWAASLRDAKVLGSRYIVNPVFGINFATGAVVRDRATWTAFARDLNRAGRMAKKAGVRLGYHNHNWEFFSLLDEPGTTGYDVLVEETDPRYVHLEMDLFWVTRGARDPVDLVKRLGRRVRQYHVKDLDQAGSFADLGEGLIDFRRIFRAHRAEEYIVERDDAGVAPRTTEQAIQTARTGFDYLRALKV